MRLSGVVNTLIDLLLLWVLVEPLGILAANVVSTSAGMASASWPMDGTPSARRASRLRRRWHS
jgi:hypothetical protein